jgi:hypothetical protein
VFLPGRQIVSYMSLDDVRISCERIYRKAPTLETGRGFVLL